MQIWIGVDTKKVGVDSKKVGVDAESCGANKSKNPPEVVSTLHFFKSTPLSIYTRFEWSRGDDASIDTNPGVDAKSQNAQDFTYNPSKCGVALQPLRIILTQVIDN